MGELTRGDAAMLARMRAAQNRGTPSGHRLPLPDGVSFADGSVHKALRARGYTGSFRVASDDEGGRYAVLVDFDKPDAWRWDAAT
ncbi:MULTISPECIES: hypothetical protein [unclassified Gordonia (in: high G+C Gram-positive bacteria)]|uniref:Uncharacterized protein n=1 Tax=Sphingomonas taxi TaxID=1549858 RepID=A0A2W4YJ36_9SPHN|nr:MULTISPECIES: hypothetical protein [unclassified Gordonia (in: high G+C Gram-positive bacteria)]MBN0975499.1 hypothetical protein [Gordonia sp. BP-119]MBN0984030.1 hypothetical protein [Gordonia sp. BP-94]PZO69574.1 MAG: hypothetical protein DI640_15320 [Sphingomonas taxi]WGJ84197.1 hypothetical protein QAD21_15530 [Gordonia sp. SMJS1]